MVSKSLNRPGSRPHWLKRFNSSVGRSAADDDTLEEEETTTPATRSTRCARPAPPGWQHRAIPDALHYQDTSLYHSTTQYCLDTSDQH